MDTKLKNGNEAKKDNEIVEKEEHQNRKRKRSGAARWLGVLTAVVAAVLFTAMSPLFDKKAREYYEEAGSEGTESEEFIARLIQSNYVFYKNVLDKSGAKNFTYDELYLTKDIEEAADGTADAKEQAKMQGYLMESAVSKNADFVPIDKMQDILEIYASQLGRSAGEIQSSYVEDIEENMDYYVLDKESGMSIKNTAQPIQELLEDVVAGDGAGAAEDISGGRNLAEDSVHDFYDYYIIMDYDEAGNLQNVSVKGRDADKMLKTVQRVESGRYGRLLPGREEEETFAFYYNDTDSIEKLLTVSQKKPVNVTFIYAMTKEQINVFQNRGYAGAYLGSNFGMQPVYYSYAQSGVQMVYCIFLLVIFVLVMLTALCAPRLLTGKEERKTPVEVIILLGIIIFAAGIEWALEMMAGIGNDYLLDWLNTNLPVNMSLGTEYDMIETVFCVSVFAAVFGAWYFCCLEFSDIVHGLKKYLQTRCCIYMLFRKISGMCKKCYRKIKTEVLDIDLGEDMGSVLRKVLFINFCLIATFCLFWFFGIFGLVIYIAALYCFLKKYIYKIQTQYEMLLEATNSMAEGKLDNSFAEDFGIFESYKEELYKVQDGFRKAVDEEVKSQRMKTELITNVSHDLKTPLTAIITYTDLLKEENITDEQRKEYLETLERKSLRLKVLIEDLFEVSRASSGNVKLDPVPVDICHLMRQVYLEYEDKMKEAKLHVRFTVPEEKVILDLDSQKTYRIFENLFVNIIKYALPDTRVFVTARRKEGKGRRRNGIHIELKNISAQEIIGNPQELSERFVRGDASRNTEGSGLGLAIAKSLTQLQGGNFTIESDGDLFKVVIDW